MSSRNVASSSHASRRLTLDGVLTSTQCGKYAQRKPQPVMDCGTMPPSPISMDERLTSSSP